MKNGKMASALANVTIYTKASHSVILSAWRFSGLISCSHRMHVGYAATLGTDLFCFDRRDRRDKRTVTV